MNKTENLLKFVAFYFILRNILVADSKSIEFAPTITSFKKCPKSEENQQFQHETDCKRYYRCVYGKLVEKTCPDNMFFNVEINNCDHFYNVLECFFNNLNGNFESQYSQYQKTIETDCPLQADYGTKTTYLSHESDINAYYVCQNGEKQLLYCPQNLQFDLVYETCRKYEESTEQSFTSSITSSTVKYVENNEIDRPDALLDQTSPIEYNNVPDCTYTVYKPFQNNPRQYLRCISGVEMLEYCPNNLVFDVKLRVCNLEYFAKTVAMI